MGIAGNILTLVFRAKAAGPVALVLTKTSVLANDGLGTSVVVPDQPANFMVVKSKVLLYVAEDINNDNKVDLADLSVLIGNWGTPRNKNADLNQDGVVNATDLSILLSKFTPMVLAK